MEWVVCVVTVPGIPGIGVAMGAAMGGGIGCWLVVVSLVVVTVCGGGSEQPARPAKNVSAVIVITGFIDMIVPLGQLVVVELLEVFLVVRTIGACVVVELP